MISALEARLKISLEHRVFKLLVSAGVLPPEALDKFEQHHGINIRQDADLGDRAFGALTPAAPANGSPH